MLVVNDFLAKKSKVDLDVLASTILVYLTCWSTPYHQVSSNADSLINLK